MPQTPTFYKRLKSFLRGVREYRSHLTTKYKEQARNDAYAAGRDLTRRITRKD